MKRALKLVGTYYRSIALVCFNTLVLFTALNLGADAWLKAGKEAEKREARAAAPFAYREYNDTLAPIYPGMTKEEVNKLIQETRGVEMGYDSYTQFKEKPCKGSYVNVDPRGFRPVMGQGTWPPEKGRFNVFVFGGSTAFGYRVADDQTIPSHLQAGLAAETGLDVRVYNFGRCSYMSLQERVLFEKLLLSGNAPALAIFFDGLNDLVFVDGEPAYTVALTKFMDRGDVGAFRQCTAGMPLVKAARILTGGTEEGEAMDTGTRHLRGLPPSVIHDVAARYRANKRIIETISEPFKVTPVFVWQPVAIINYDSKYNIFGGFDYHTFTPWVKPGYELMRDLAASGVMGDNFIWAADIQKDLAQPVYADAYHYSGDMCRRIARFIILEMKAGGLVDRAAKGR
ncbi:MAG: SGNH/GDSL hydrolase family protein [Pseudomonadota bacterium]